MTPYSCPWCSSPTQAEPIDERAKLWFVSCLNSECAVSGPLMPSKEEATLLWNDVAGKR